MSLLLDERSMCVDAELLVPGAALRVCCKVTVEWLRGIAEPTWYGYLTVPNGVPRVLPGRYTLRLPEESVSVLLRRVTTVAERLCFPFWGVGHAPAVPAACNVTAPANTES